MDLASLSNHSGHAARKSNQAIGLIYKKNNNFICLSHFGYFFGSLHTYNMKGSYATMKDNSTSRKFFLSLNLNAV